ncbi:MAG TPA: RDD family protein [Candidatus Angelobacter sp.]|nr:RDD family protein [Candidatus Angelobacter sp.]
MTCPVCGQALPCAHSREWGSDSSALLDHQVLQSAAAGEPVGSEAMTGTLGLAPEPVWRQEVVSRIQQHRARRRRPADPNALELDFTANEPFSFAPPPSRFAEIMVKAEPKVIRFPRPAPEPATAVQEVRLDELPSRPETPRIVEDPTDTYLAEVQPAPVEACAEQMQLLPSFADIRLEPAPSLVAEEDEFIPRPAPLSQRVAAGVLDAALVVIAGGLFGLTFLKLAEEIPHSRMMLVCALAAGGIFWLLFQYMFLTYARTTPGMRVAQLELSTFAGDRPARLARQCRALASALSAFSAGLGYAWAFIDEDRLGWHDRMTQTYVKSSTQHSAFSTQP